MPGHKGAKGAPPAGRALLGDVAYDADVSEMGGFDYLHHPEGALLESTARAARLFGAARSWFLVNGATVGNLAAICATVGEGDTLLLARGSHRSAYAALALSGARPLYLPPVAHPAIDGLFGVDPAAVGRALDAHPEIRAVHVTSPSYHGLCVDLAAVARLAHDAGVPLIVDEAHGSHFVAHPGLPAPALSLGADLVVHSPHKTLGSLTQSSLLHHQGELVDAERVDGLLQMLQSSSPSALLLVSLDVAVAELAATGTARWARALSLAGTVRAAAGRYAPLCCYGEELRGVGGIADYDPSKLVIDVVGLGWSAPEAAAYLAGEWRIRPEFSDLRRMVFSLTAADDDESAALLVDALADLAAAGGVAVPGEGPVSRWPGEVPEMRRTPREASMAPAAGSLSLPRDEALGRVAAEMVVPYPPGIPLLVPGEVVSAAVLESIEQLLAAGCRIVGMADAEGAMLRCLAD